MPVITATAPINFFRTAGVDRCFAPSAVLMINTFQATTRITLGGGTMLSTSSVDPQNLAGKLSASLVHPFVAIQSRGVHHERFWLNPNLIRSYQQAGNDLLVWTDSPNALTLPYCNAADLDTALNGAGHTLTALQTNRALG